MKSSRKYLSSLKRIVTGTNRNDTSARIELQHKQIATIDRHIEQGYLMVDMVNAVVSIDPYLHIYYQQAIQGDDTKLYRGFCLMLRLWINYQRAYKKGELLRLLEEGCYDTISTREMADIANRKPFRPCMQKLSEAPTLPSSTLSLEERQAWLEQYIEKRYGTLSDTTPLLIIVIDNEGNTIATVEECTHDSSINFQTVSEKKDE